MYKINAAKQNCLIIILFLFFFKCLVFVTSFLFSFQKKRSRSNVTKKEIKTKHSKIPPTLSGGEKKVFPAQKKKNVLFLFYCFLIIFS